MIIFLILILPFTILGIFISNNKKEILIISLIGSILNLIQILIIFENMNLQFSYYQYQLFSLFGIDLLSIWLLILIGILLPIILLNISYNKINKMKMILLISIAYISMIIFLVIDTLLFYISYEILLIPMYYLIGYYGSRNRKITALFEFYIYTLFGSLLLLLVILLFYYEIGHTSYEYISNNSINLYKQNIFFFLLLIAFGIKIPMIPLHIWLPEAHVEAPTSVSVYLAAILLKLGGYGFIRFSLGFLPLASSGILISLIYTLGIIGVIYTSIACITLWDIKKIIAYSSIGHMNLAILGIFSNNIYGLSGSIYFMISHGIISSGLFILIGILYDRYHTRIIKYYKGLVLILPLFSLFLCFFTLANIAFPLTSGYISEILTFIGIIKINPFIGILATFAIILTPFYALWFYHKIIYGSYSSYISPSFDLSLKEFHILFPLFFFTLFLGIFPNIILNTIDIISFKYLI